MFSAIISVVSISAAFLTSVLSSLVPLIIDKREARRASIRNFEQSRRERIEAFITYSAIPVSSRKNIIEEYVELNKYYGILSHYCTFSEMQAVEKFIKVMASTGNSDHTRRRAYLEVCACLSKLNSPYLSEEDLAMVEKAWEEENKIMNS